MKRLFFALGILVGSFGPLSAILLPMISRWIGSNEGYDYFLLCLFPLSLSLMLTEFFPPFLSALFFICMSFFNIVMFAGFGYLLGLTLEKIRVENSVKKKVKQLIVYSFLSLIGLILFFGSGLFFSFVVQEFLVNGKWLKGIFYLFLFLVFIFGEVVLFKKTQPAKKVALTELNKNSAL
ncbi:MAG: hypothetical protein Q7T03_03065 [Deltaproteobacteria bacterium]|nr:hypothetical protein [Deltaproteobacteria bacterium]